MDYKKGTSDPDVLIAEGTVVVGDVKLAKGVSVWYNAVLRGDESPIEVGENTNIQDGAILHARAVVGSNCTVGHCAIIHGCTVGSHTLIGMGSILLDGAKIGNHCIVGAGALVTGKLDAPDGSMILGSPAKVVRPLTQEEMDSVDASVQEYLEFAQHYRASHE